MKYNNRDCKNIRNVNENKFLTKISCVIMVLVMWALYCLFGS